ncbi:MAG: phosphatase PAP2 family protein [Sneathiella sp.]|nr:phosphatase PAP2 family protein [Sneathiella sp.]
MFDYSERGAWRPKIFFACYAGIALLAVSLLWQPTAMIWRQIDEVAYYTLNGSLDGNPAWTYFWGHLTTSKANIFIGTIMVLPLLWVLAFNRSQTAVKRFSTVTLVVLFVSVGVLIAKTCFDGVNRISPSLELLPFYDMNLLVDGIKAKTGSTKSFPGDHAVTTLIYAVLVIAFMRSRMLTTFAIIVAIINTLPRLFAGSHWLSDIVVGSGALALFIFPFALATPSLRLTEMIWRQVFSLLNQSVATFFRKSH